MAKKGKSKSKYSGRVPRLERKKLSENETIFARMIAIDGMSVDDAAKNMKEKFGDRRHPGEWSKMRFGWHLMDKTIRQIKRDNDIYDDHGELGQELHDNALEILKETHASLLRMLKNDKIPPKDMPALIGRCEEALRTHGSKPVREDVEPTPLDLTKKDVTGAELIDGISEEKKKLLLGKPQRKKKVKG